MNYPDQNSWIYNEALDDVLALLSTDWMNGILNTTRDLFVIGFLVPDKNKVAVS